MTKNINPNAAVLALVTSAVAAWSRAEESDRERLVRCASATYAVADANLIGKDQSGNGGWESQKDYAAKYVSGRTGKPVSASTVTLWRRVGRAMNLGITHDSADPKVAQAFSRLVQVGNVKAVGEACDSGSKSAILKAVAGQFNRDGSRKPTPKPATADTAGEGGTGTTDGNTPDVPVTRNNSTTMDAVEALLARITKPSKAEKARLADISERCLILAGLVEAEAEPVAKPIAS